MISQKTKKKKLKRYKFEVFENKWFIAGLEKFDDSWMGNVAFSLQHDATSEEIILYDCCFLIVAVGST
jgi:hypothetical protein